MIDTQRIIDAIKNQRMLEIIFNKERDGNISVKNIAPYDVYPKNDKNCLTRDVLLGYAESNHQKEAHVIMVYIDNIRKITELSKPFDGNRIRILIEPKNPPYISRHW
jgi:hypothetical protein